MRHGLIGVGVLLLLVTAGCGDDSGGSDGGPALTAQCANPADIAIAEEAALALLDGGLPDGGSLDGTTALSTGLRDCARTSCLTNILNGEGVAECMDLCLSGQAIASLSSGCISCFTEVIGCSANHCVVECLGSDPEACTTCGQMFCVPRLDECTALR